MSFNDFFNAFPIPIGVVTGAIIGSILRLCIKSWQAKKSGKPLRKKEPLGKMAKQGCPQCGAPVAVNDESCVICDKKLK